MLLLLLLRLLMLLRLLLLQWLDNLGDYLVDSPSTVTETDASSAWLRRTMVRGLRVLSHKNMPLRRHTNDMIAPESELLGPSCLLQASRRLSSK